VEESGGRVYTAEGGNGGAVAAYDAGSGARACRLWTGGDTQAVAVLGTRVYIGGHFNLVGGDYGVLKGREPRDVFAAVDAATCEWDPQWAPTVLTRATKAEGQVWALDADPSRGRLYAAGEFTNISGRPQQGFAQFSE
jgi:hypothetical protein